MDIRNVEYENVGGPFENFIIWLIAFLFSAKTWYYISMDILRNIF